MESNRGASPDSAQPAEQTVTPAAATADASSSTAQDNVSEFSARAAAANTPQAVLDLVRDSVEGKVSDKPAVKPTETADPLPPDLQAAANTPAETTDTETTTETPETTTEEGADDTDETALGDGPVTPIRSNRPRVQLPTNDEVGRLAISYQKRNRDWTLSEAIAAAEKQLGIKHPAPTAPDATQNQEESQLPQTVDAVTESIKQLRAERKKANAELRFEDSSDISDRLEDLIEHKSKLERQAEQSQIAKATQYDRDFTASEAKANELYEFTAQADSPGAKRMLEIEADLKALDDPIYYSPDKPLKIAQMVAREMNIAPRRKGAPVVPKVTPTPVVVPKKNVLPGGESRTVPPAVAAKPAIDAKIEGIRTLGDLTKVYQELGISL